MWIIAALCGELHADAVIEFEDVVLVGDDAGFWCSGVVVAPRIVLTAGHCAHATRVGVGRSIAAVASVAVVGTLRHEREDIAVLSLAEDVHVALHPIRLDERETAPSSEIAIVGFGVRDQVRFTGFGERRARRVLADGWGCDRGRARALGCRHETELLLRGGRGNDTCFGDSGGGAFERIADQWRLVGITSRGTSPKRVLCGEGGVYVRTDAVQGWLRQGGVR